MKRQEKYLLGIFGSCAVLSIAFLLCELLVLDKGFGYFDDVAMVLPYYMIFVAVFGIIAILVSCRLRKRNEIGEKPISMLYHLSFILSFMPLFLVLFVVLIRHGSNAFADNLVGYIQHNYPCISFDDILADTLHYQAVTV